LVASKTIKRLGKLQSISGMCVVAVPQQQQFWQYNALPFLSPLNVTKLKALLILQPFVPKIRDSFSVFALEHWIFPSSPTQCQNTNSELSFMHPVWYLCLPSSQLHFAFHHGNFVLMAG
jgi:hypothetical protein